MHNTNSNTGMKSGSKYNSLTNISMCYISTTVAIRQEKRYSKVAGNSCDITRKYRRKFSYEEKGSAGDLNDPSNKALEQ